MPVTDSDSCRRRSAWRVPATVIGLALLAGLLRFPWLGSIPPGFHYDEALEALEAWRVLNVAGYHPIYFPGDFGIAPLFIYLVSAAFAVFPALPEVSRAVAALVGTATVLGLFGLAREVVRADDRISPATPVLAAATLAGLRWHVTFSRIGIEPILVPLFLVLILWLLLSALRTNRPGLWLLLGLTTGLSVYSYPAAWLLPPMLAAVVLALALVQRERVAGRWRGIGLAGAAALIVAGPLAIALLTGSTTVLTRSGQVSLLSSESIAGTLPAALWDNLGKTLGLFTVVGDVDPRSNIPGTPALDPIFRAPFFLGLLMLFLRPRRMGSVVLLLAGGAMLATTLFTDLAPHFRRAVGLTPIIALLVGSGLAHLMGWGRRLADRLVRSGLDAAPWRRSVARSVVTVGIVGTLAGGLVMSAYAYFVEWGTSPDLFYAYDQGLWEIGQFVKGLPAESQVYISPRAAGEATLAFAWSEGPAVRHFDGRHGLLAPVSDRDTIYIVIDYEDVRSARLISELYPEAVETWRLLDRDGEVYARALQVPAGAEPTRGPKVAVSVSWPGIELVGYDTDRSSYRAGDSVYLQLWWRATASGDTDWTVFTHMEGPERADGERLWSGHDGQPVGDSLPFSSWTAGDLVLDEHELRLSAEIPAGEYQLSVGLYDLARGGGQRAVLTEPAGGDSIIVGSLRVE